MFFFLGNYLFKLTNLVFFSKNLLVGNYPCLVDRTGPIVTVYQSRYLQEIEWHILPLNCIDTIYQR